MEKREKIDYYFVLNRLRCGSIHFFYKHELHKVKLDVVKIQTDFKIF